MPQSRPDGERSVGGAGVETVWGPPTDVRKERWARRGNRAPAVIPSASPSARVGCPMQDA